MRVFGSIRDTLRKLHGWPSRDATVDPSAFPEAEFPVRCLGCSYLLTGLPDGWCPECGREFARGRLLVEQYAGESLPRRGGRYGLVRRWLNVSFAVVIGGQVLALLMIGLFSFVASDVRLMSLADWPSVLGRAMYAILVAQLAVVAVDLGLCIALARLLPSRDKRDAVRAALGLPLLRDRWKFRWR